MKRPSILFYLYSCASLLSHAKKQETSPPAGITPLCNDTFDSLKEKNWQIQTNSFDENGANLVVEMS